MNALDRRIQPVVLVMELVAVEVGLDHVEFGNARGLVEGMGDAVFRWMRPARLCKGGYGGVCGRALTWHPQRRSSRAPGIELEPRHSRFGRQSGSGLD